MSSKEEFFLSKKPKKCFSPEDEKLPLVKKSFLSSSPNKKVFSPKRKPFSSSSCKELSFFAPTERPFPFSFREEELSFVFANRKAFFLILLKKKGFHLSLLEKKSFLSSSREEKAFFSSTREEKISFKEEELAFFCAERKAFSFPF